MGGVIQDRVGIQGRDALCLQQKRRHEGRRILSTKCWTQQRHQAKEGGDLVLIQLLPAGELFREALQQAA